MILGEWKKKLKHSENKKKEVINGITSEPLTTLSIPGQYYSKWCPTDISVLWSNMFGQLSKQNSSVKVFLRVIDIYKVPPKGRWIVGLAYPPLMFS